MTKISVIVCSPNFIFNGDCELGDWWVTPLSAGATIAALVFMYHGVIRPWHLRWGTIDDEATRPLPGDDFVSEKNLPVTHAISINAGAKDVWPWLVQMGQGRGGFYSYTWLENLIGCQIKNADEIVPEWQHLEVGDPISLHPKTPPLRVMAMEERRALVLGSRSDSERSEAMDRGGSQVARQLDWSWAFVLDERTEDHTRLIVRVRENWGMGWKVSLMNYLIIEPGHFIMNRRLLLGIKRRVESI